MSADIKVLIGKLNSYCKKSMETAAALCVANSNYNVEIEHFLLSLLDNATFDVCRILKYYDIKVEDVIKSLQSEIDSLKRGNTRTPALSDQIITLLQEAFIISSLKFQSPQIRSASILLALFENATLRGVIYESCKVLLKIDREKLNKEIVEIVKSSSTEVVDLNAEKKQSQTDDASNKSDSANSKSALKQFTVDLTDRARMGAIDPIKGRDSEIRQIIDILSRRRQNNPIITGEAGVGKTAVVEGFAQKVVAGEVPPSLKDVSVLVLDMGLLQAGAGVKGEFENRLKSVIEEVKSTVKPIILFIDEAHTIIGAGGQAGQNDAANLLKPALARGDLRTIAATTWLEYKKYFEKDPALTRRFQVVQVDEPSEEMAVEMLRGMVTRLEHHHSVRILDDAIHKTVRLSHRFLTDRKLPDSAISVLDTACARVAISQNSTPPLIEDLKFKVNQLEIEESILIKEEFFGSVHKKRLEKIAKEIVEYKKNIELLTAKLKSELDLVKKVETLKKEIEKLIKDKKDAKIIAETTALLQAAQKELAEQQADSPMIHVDVDSFTVASIISEWTGIPTGKMLANDVDNVLNLKSLLQEKIIGQSKQLDQIVKRIQISQADLLDPNKPIGVFMLAGPSGVGKTETAVSLADILYGGEKNLITINMSEFQEAHTVSSLKGAPPGYVGYGKGGVLTEAVRKKPYSVVLLDEVEKAHPDVMEMFYQVFDKGVMEDGEGVRINFKNTVILLTTNLGTAQVMQATQNGKVDTGLEKLDEIIRPELVQRFKPALIGRMVVVPYAPLKDKEIEKIAELKFNKVKKRFIQNYGAEFEYDQEIIQEIGQRCVEVDSGARNVDNIINNNLLPEISQKILESIAEDKKIKKIKISVNKKNAFTVKITHF